MDKVNAFKSTAQQMGYTEQEVNDFMSTIPEGQYEQRGYQEYLTEKPLPQGTTEMDNLSGYSPEEQGVVKEMLAAKRSQYTPSLQAEPETYAYQSQYGILPEKAPITQTFGQKSRYDVFSGGVNYGVDVAVREGTPVALPEGEWEVIESFNGAGRGYIGDGTNQGYGNSVLVKNRKTGEMMRLSHLSGVGVKPGQLVTGGTVIGESGSTGNSTAGHLDLEYYNARGEIADVLRSPYKNYLFGGQAKQQSMAPRLNLTL